MTRPPSPLATYPCPNCHQAGQSFGYIPCTESVDYFGCPDCDCEVLEWGFVCVVCRFTWGVNVRTGIVGNVIDHREPDDWEWLLKRRPEIAALAAVPRQP